MSLASPLVPDPVIVAQGVTKSWGQLRALDSVDATVGRGVTGLLGSNGAGKTTFIKVALGLFGRDSGSLEVLGQDPSESGPEVRQLIGYAPEHHHLPGDVQAADLVRHIARLHGIPKQVASDRSSDTLWEVGLGEERFRPIGTFSTGQRQRVKLAQAIVHDPSLVILDEPTDGLDPVQRDDMLALIRRIGTEHEIDVLLSSHRLEEVERICDSVIILREGVVARSGQLDELRGSTEGLDLIVLGGVADLAAALQARGLDVEVQGESLTVDAEGLSQEEMSRRVRDCLAELGTPLRSLRPRRASLEDIYLDAQ
jgi:ABC-2 type transport system ATP-binding protein